jgi:hypothetical protein
VQGSGGVEDDDGRVCGSVSNKHEMMVLTSTSKVRERARVGGRGGCNISPDLE